MPGSRGGPAWLSDQAWTFMEKGTCSSSEVTGCEGESSSQHYYYSADGRERYIITKQTQARSRWHMGWHVEGGATDIRDTRKGQN